MPSKPASDHEIYAKTVEAKRDDSLPYVGGHIAKRLTLHPSTDPDFISAFLAKVGGSCHPDHGGTWQRSRTACEFLRGAERPATPFENKMTRVSFDANSGPTRALIESYVVTAGVTTPIGSQLLTQGELMIWQYFASYVTQLSDPELALIVDSFGPVEVLNPPSSAAPPAVEAVDGAGAESPLPLTPPRRTVVLEDGVTVPDDYTDDLPVEVLEGTIEDVKTAVRTYAHKVLIAELSRGEKQRTSLIKWLEAKAKGHKIPAEWRDG